jgi:hypothetical protein
VKQFLILVTGSPNSGKTEFSSRTAKILNYKYINIGSELLKYLTNLGFDITLKDEIGPRFFEHASFNDYLSIVKDNSSYGVVLDGVRFVEAVRYLRNLYRNLVHIHRIPPNDIFNVQNMYTYGDQLSLLEEIADFKVNWKESAESLDDEIRDIFNQL